MKRASPGEPRAFLESLVGYSGNECVPWPFARSNQGYGVIYLKRRKPIGAHRAMCILAHGDPFLIWNEAAHSCGNRLCVNPNHLSWKNKAGNAADRLLHGTAHRGESSPTAKITEQQAREIRASKERTGVLAMRHGIACQTVGHIRAGRRWKHLAIADAPTPSTLNQGPTHER